MASESRKKIGDIGRKSRTEKRKEQDKKYVAAKKSGKALGIYG